MYVLPNGLITLALATGKDCRDLTQTVDTHCLAFKIVDLHSFTTEDAGMEMVFDVGETLKRDDNGLTG